MVKVNKSLLKYKERLYKILKSKNQSITALSKELGYNNINVVSRKLRSVMYTKDEIQYWISIAKAMFTQYSICPKCKVKIFKFNIHSINRVFCDKCSKGVKTGIISNTLRYNRRPNWVRNIKDKNFRNIVEQEYYVNPDFAKILADSGNYDNALVLRSKYYNVKGTSAEKIKRLLNVCRFI